MQKNKFWLSLALLILFSFGASAEVIKMKTKSSAKITSGLKDCLSDAGSKAKQKAVSKVIKKLSKGVSDEVIQKVYSDSGDAVIKFKILKKKDVGDGSCYVKARVSIDKKELTALLNEYLSEKISDKEISVGAVVRFIIDGKLADGQGSDSQEALSKLSEELQKYGIEVVDLSPLLMKYAAQKSRDWEAVALAEGEKRKSDAKIDSSAALQQLITTIKEVWKIAPDALRKFDAVAAGQVFVRSKGRDPQGPGYISEVSSYIKVISLKDGTDLASSFVPGTIDGQTQPTANIEAMMLSIENNVNVIAKSLAK